MATKRKVGAAGAGAGSTPKKGVSPAKPARAAKAVKAAAKPVAEPRAAAAKKAAPRSAKPIAKAPRAGTTKTRTATPAAAVAEPVVAQPAAAEAPAAVKVAKPKARVPRKAAPPAAESTREAGAPRRALIEVRGDEPDAEADPAATAKLAVGPAAEAEERPAQIPWSYAQDRVTAMAVDPDRLFVYWEVTDPAIERARAALGKGGPGAWLDLRVYDTTGLIFDGTNAHSYFDHAVDRDTRQWFFQIGKPTSTAFVELGMRSTEGYFARIVRSGRVDFPRREPAPWGDPEWMTVRPWSGEVADVHRAPAPRPGGGAMGGGGEGGRWFSEPAIAWTLRDQAALHEVVLRQLLESGWERVEWRQGEGEGWYELEGRVEWESPRVLTSWEAGPFDEPVQIRPPERQEREGQGFAFRSGGVTHVVEGPWQVVIRGVGARASREVLGRWEIHRSWSILGGRVFRAARGGEGGMGGSEGRWIEGSEARLGGASERWRIGASELAWRGASEQLLAGASERRYAGASERSWAGASEARLGGASERAYAGASERRLGGSSERQLGGGSERPGGSEERFEGPTAPPLGYPTAGSGSQGGEG